MEEIHLRNFVVRLRCLTAPHRLTEVSAALVLRPRFAELLPEVAAQEAVCLDDDVLLIRRH
jgi:hypothetical protein